MRVGEIRRLARMQCTEAEAAAVLGIKTKTFVEMIRIDERARTAWEDGRNEGRVKIRKAQFALAERHPQMAIYLGKVVLGQREVTAIEMSGPNGGPIRTLDLEKLDATGRKQLREILLKTRKDESR